MKKLSALLLAALLALTLAACVGAPASSQPPVSSSAPASSSVSQPQSAVSSPQEPEDFLSTWVLTGKELPQDYAQDRRVTAVVVDNYFGARPQRGLSEADILFECQVEGGITRFLALYADYRSMPQVGSVRSSRDQFFQLAYPFQAIFVTMGSSQHNDNFIEIFGYDDHTLDAYSNYVTTQDDDRVAAGYDSLYAQFTSGQQIADALAENDLSGERVYKSTFFRFVPHTEEPRVLPQNDGQSILIHFSEHYGTAFAWDEGQGRYEMAQRNIDGALEPTIDENTDGELAFDNVLVLFAEMPAHEGLDADVRNVQFGYGGVGYYFNGGGAQRIHWSKESPAHGLKLLDGEDLVTELEINPGTSYVALVDVEVAADFAYGAPGVERKLG